MRENRKSYRLPLIVGLAVGIGVLLGANLRDSSKPEENITKSVMKFREILNYVSHSYVDSVDTDSLAEYAIYTMLEKLDPHTTYIPAEDREISQTQLQGEFEGIGIEFNILRDTLHVVGVIPGGPSEEVGLKPGDKIVSVDQENVASVGLTNMKVFDLLRGPKGTKVKLEIVRKQKRNPITFTITRDKIPQHSVDVSYMVNEEIGYIKVTRFSRHTYEEFMDALTKLQAEGMKKLVLDLQGNPGGYMDMAIRISDEFLAGNPMIVYTDGKGLRYDSKHYAHYPGRYEEGALIVLIDEGSASASEIVSGAMQDNDRGLIVGRRSFGKGLVQLGHDLNDGSELRLTISRYYTPSGRSIQKPYDHGQQDYALDTWERFENGEFFHKDSIKFDEELKYKTSAGRTVYGGGGIMPDYFVPLDTLHSSSFVNELFYSNVIREFTLDYTDRHRKELEKMDLDEFVASWEVSDKMLATLNDMASEAGIEREEEDYAKGLDHLKIHIKAQVARGIWGNEGFYPIYNQTNEIFQKALKLFGEAEKLASSQ